MTRIQKTIHRCLLLLALFGSGLVSAQPDPLMGLDAEIRQSIAEWAEWQVPGLAIAVVKDDEVVFLEGYGVRELGKGARVDEHTVFSLGSVTKGFTAATVGLLVDEGRLSWDDPVIEHLPWFRVPDPWVTRRVTIRDLLSHRLAGDVGSGLRFLERLSSIKREDLLKRLGSLESGTGGFRSRFQYCNVCYSIAGQIVEAVSGSSWQGFVRARLFDPLGMNSAAADAYEVWDAEYVLPCYTCGLPARTVGFEDARLQDVAMPHMNRSSSDETLWPVPWTGGTVYAPAGSVSASAADIARWMRLQLGMGSYDGKRILSPGVLEEMHTGQMIMPTQRDAELFGPGFGHFWSVGLGWFLTDYQGRKMSFHAGGGNGFSSFIALVPEEKLGVALMRNASFDFLDRIIVFGVLNAYLGSPDRDWRRKSVARVEAGREAWRQQQQSYEAQLAAGRSQGTTPSLPIEAYLGEYSHPAVGKLRLLEEDGGLVLRFPGAWAGDLEHWHHDVFRLTGRGPAHWQLFLTFVLDPAGQVDEFRIRELAFERLPDQQDEEGESGG